MKFIILGCGSSMGVPRSDGFFGACDPKEKKNYRTRCSALLTDNKFNILIDTSPDLRYQLISNKIKNINKVLYTHNHADQTHGINDLRVFYLLQKKTVNIYSNLHTANYLQKSFAYCFEKNPDYPQILKLNKVKKKMVFNKSIRIQSISVKHGRINSLAYIFNKKLAYAPDLNKIYTKDLKYFKNLEFFVIDCLRYKKHPSHFNLDDVLELNKILKPKKMILTNLHSDFDYKNLKKNIPKNFDVAYDGMEIKLS